MLYTTLRIIFAVIFQLLFRAKTYGKENLPAEGPVILAANHMSNWDPPLLATFLPRPVSYMAKIELFEHPIFGAAIRRCHAFPGRVLGLFPEGTRSKDGKLHKAEAGVGLLAAMSGAPVVPACIVGTDRIMQKGGFLPKLSIMYGEPMHFTGDKRDKEQLEAFSQEIMAHIAVMREEIEKIS